MSTNELLYFAYGSNMSTRRLCQRVPSARAVDVAELAGHRLAWHKKSGDGSGKCDIIAARPDEVVHGVLYAIDPGHKADLDVVESLGRGYQEKWVDLWLPRSREKAIAFTYYAILTDSTYLPYGWYRDHVLIGAREHGLPHHYIRMIENVPAFEDPDRQRDRRQRRLHEQG